MTATSVQNWSFRFKVPEGSTTIFIENSNPPHIQIFVGKAGTVVAGYAYALAEMTNLALASNPLDVVIDKLTDISSDHSVFHNGVWCRSLAEAVSFALLEYSRKVIRKS